MAWKHLTIDDLRMVLSEDEIQKLNTYSTDEDITNIINSQLDIVADAFRGAWASKGYTIDARAHYVAPEYVQFVLNYARWQIWTRFPMAEDYALSEPRKAQFDESVELLKDPYIGVSTPDYSDDPDLSSTVLSSSDAAITLPWMKFPAEPFETGFYQVYPLINRSF